MNLRDFQRFLEPRIGMDKSQIETRVRRLREAGLLPTGGRGRNAPDIDVTHAALVLLAIAASEYSTDATGVIDLIGGAEAFATRDNETFVRSATPYLGCRTVLSLLVHLLSNKDDIEDISSIQIYSKTALVKITRSDGKVGYYLKLTEEGDQLRPVNPKAQYISAQPNWELSAVFLRDTANELERASMPDCFVEANKDFKLHDWRITEPFRPKRTIAD